MAKVPTARGRRASVCIRVDGTALKRGFTRSGETCHIPGVGPVPVAVVRRQLPDAFVKILVREGKDVTTVCHAGRTVTAHVQSALEERDPACVVPGCDVAQGLENHHWDVDYVVCRTTSLAGLARVCHWHHGLLTYGGYVPRRGTGAWVMRGPPGGDRSRPRLATPIGTGRSSAGRPRPRRSDRAGGTGRSTGRDAGAPRWRRSEPVGSAHSGCGALEGVEHLVGHARSPRPVPTYRPGLNEPWKSEPPVATRPVRSAMRRSTDRWSGV